MMELMELIQNLSPAQRIAVVGLTVGGIVNGIKRWPKVPSQWVPLTSLLLAAALSSAYYYVANMTHEGMLDFVLQAVLAGALPIAGHKFLKKPWVALLGEESADKWLGQADSSKPPATKPSSAVLLVLMASLCLPVMGCGGSWGKVSNNALEAVAKSNNDLVSTLDKIQNAARESRKEIMKKIAETAPSKEAGMKALDEVDKAYDHVWVALEHAEDAQHALAKAIEAARALIDLGQMPSLDNVMKLFSDLQAAQAAVSHALAEVN